MTEARPPAATTAAAPAAPPQEHWYRIEEFAPRRLFDYLRLRSEIFVVEQNAIYSDLDDLDLDSTHLVLVTQDGRVAGGLRLFAPGAHYTEAGLGRVVIAPRQRGRGIGHQLIAAATARSDVAFDRAPIRISAQAHLQGFYARHGFISEGEQYLEANIRHIAMVRPAGGR